MHRYFHNALIALAVLLTGCTFSARPVYIEDEKKKAELAIEQLHERINAEQYEAIYDDAHPQFQAVSAKDQTISAMIEARERTGKILQVTERQINYVKGDPIPLRAIYDIKCEKGEFNEWIAFAVSSDGKKALLTQYQIFPGHSPQSGIGPKR